MRTIGICVLSVVFAGLLPSGGAAAEPQENWVYPAEIASWSDAEKERQRDNAAKLLADIKKAKEEGRKSFAIPKDDYRFGSKSLPNFQLEDVNGMDIDGSGSTFWINGRIRYDGIKLVRCSDLKIRNLTVDCDPFGYIQTTVKSVDANERTLVVEVNPGFPLPDETWNKKVGDIKAIFLKPDASYHNQKLDWIKTIAPAKEGGRLFKIELRDGSIFVYGTPVAPGDSLLLPDRGMRNAFNLDACSRVTLENINIYAAAHMAIVEYGGDGPNTYRNCRVVPRPGTKRLLACNADVFHSIMLRHGPTIENCEFSEACDDLINIHGFFGMVFRQESPTELLMTIEPVKIDLSGETLRFIGWQEEKLIGEAKVLSCEELKDEALKAQAMEMPARLVKEVPGARIRNFGKFTILRLKLDRPVEAPQCTVVDNYAFTGAGAVIRNNYFRRSVARGVLLKGANSVFEGNRMEKIGHTGLLVATDRYFFENACPSKIVVRNNTFTDCNLFLSSRLWLNGQHAVVAVWNDGRDQSYSRLGTSECSDITIAGNKIVRAPTTAIFMANTLRGSITGNTIVEPGFAEPDPKSVQELTDNAYAIYVACSEGVKISGNTVLSPGKWCKGAVGLGPLLKDCKADSNTVK